MKMECEIIRDLLPLYVDDACSDASRTIVESHLEECPDCSSVLKKLRETELEDDLHREKHAVIEYGAKKFKRRSAVVGSTVSGVFMIPILIFLILNLTAMPMLSWYYIVIAAFLVAASLIAVPLIVPEDKLFWTFCAFCASLIVLLGVTCLSTRGDWFLVAASAVLFGLIGVFLPFLMRARPLKRLIGKRNKVLIAVGVDGVLFANMMYMIATRGRITGRGILFTLAIIAGIALVFLGIIRVQKR